MHARGKMRLSSSIQAYGPSKVNSLMTPAAAVDQEVTRASPHADNEPDVLLSD